MTAFTALAPMSAALLATSAAAFFTRSAVDTSFDSLDPPFWPGAWLLLLWLARLVEAAPRARVARLAAAPPVARAVLLRAVPLLRAADGRLLAAVVERLAAAPPRLAVAPRFAVVERFAAPPPRLAAPLAAPFMADVLLRFVALFLVALFLIALFFVAAPRLAAPAVLRAPAADLRAADAGPLFLAAGRRADDALFAPARPDDDRLLLAPLDDARLRAPPAPLLERPLDRLPLFFALLRDDFVAMCGLL